MFLLLFYLLSYFLYRVQIFISFFSESRAVVSYDQIYLGKAAGFGPRDEKLNLFDFAK